MNRVIAEGPGPTVGVVPALLGAVLLALLLTGGKGGPMHRLALLVNTTGTWSEKSLIVRLIYSRHNQDDFPGRLLIPSY